MSNRVSLKEIVGGGYYKFWHFKGRYRVVKGSRASKKSKTMGLWSISGIMKYPDANMLVIRKTGETLKNSCFTELKWAIHRLGVDDYWKINLSPLEMTYIPTGQKIYFRGLDDPLKVTSITVDVGVLCWMWIEEAYEIMDEAAFDTLDESIRGITPNGLFKQITLTFNSWNEKHWIKKRFFDVEDDNILAMTTNYMCNEWLDEHDLQLFEDMKKKRPKRYNVAGLGNWGVVDGLIYEDFVEKAFDVDEIRAMKGIRSAFGLDFGYTNDPTALFCGLVDNSNKTIYVFDEIYERGLTNIKIAEKIKEKGFAKERIKADSAEPKSVDEIWGYGVPRIIGATKGRDSISHGIQVIQEYKIIIHPKCVNFITEINNYCWETDKTGKKLNVPCDDFNHLMDAMRYAVQDVVFGDMFSFE